MKRRTGVVVPLAALYTKECAAVGDFMALKPFADYCEKCGFSVIQLLPVNDTGTHSSPYSGLSAFALHPLYIRIDALPEFADAKKHSRNFASAYKSYKEEFKYNLRFDYTKLSEAKNQLLHLMYSYIEKRLAAKAKSKAKEVSASGALSFEEELTSKMEEFVAKNDWVIPYAVFKNLKDDHMQDSWKNWEDHLKNMSRDKILLRWKNKALKSSHNFFVWCQMRAHEQFKEAAEYLRSKDIMLKGDIPILMNEDSADCWSWPEYFNQEWRAGSPPDGENPMGQNWGFPTYNWEKLKADSNYEWWRKRVAAVSEYYSAFRIDHILGFFRIWAVQTGENTAFLGHTIPHASIHRQKLVEIGFDKGRIHWLCQSHIPTSLIEDITWNHDEAVACLEKVCLRVGTEELWNFKDEIQTDRQIYDIHFFDDERKDKAVKEALIQKKRDKALIDISKAPEKEEVFIPVYSYKDSTAWKSLSWEEQQKFEGILTNLKDEENVIWKREAEDKLKAITKETSMLPCAEDLGVNLAVMPQVLQELGIFSLKVIRWNRNWGQEGQPYVKFTDYPELSVATTSVHDSPTLRQWWQYEKDSVRAFIRMAESEGIKIDCNADDAFSGKIAELCLKATSACKSALFINPLQDYLFMEDKYFLENPDDERINVPGSVNNFNWTYRLPVSIEDLSKDTDLIQKIQGICNSHDN